MLESEAFRAMKAKHKEFYAEQMKALDANLAATSSPLIEVQLEADAELPFGLQSFDRSAKAAAASHAASVQHFATRGGSSKKTDALQELILEIVRSDQKITEPQLLSKLRRLQHGDVIDEIDDPTDPEPAIHFQKRNGSSGEAPLSGLKDRLSRAKKIVRKEIAEGRSRDFAVLLSIPVLPKIARQSRQRRDRNGNGNP